MARTVDSTSGVTLVLHDLGGAGPRPLLVAHATGFCGRVYQPLVARLSGYRVWAPDLRGHGDSTPPDDGHFAWEGLADDVGAVIAALGGGPFFGFGHSMGAAVSLLAESRRPGSFAALYCFEPIVIPPEIRGGRPRESPIVEATRRRRREFASLEEARANFASKPPLSELAPESLRAYLDHGFHHLDDGRLRIKMDPEHEAGMYQMSPEHPTWDHLHEVGCPVVVASGRPEPMRPAAWTERIAARLPRGRVEIFEDLGHMGPLERPDRIAAAISRFFDEVAEGSAG